jgi:protein-tyrosine phosphatase
VSMSVLVVCEGNLCRSPMAAALLQHELGDDFAISSAGTAAPEGKPADALAAELMRERGIDLTSHLARTVNLQMMRENEVVIAMTSFQREWLLQRYPFARGRVFQLLPGVANDVTDPYRHGRAAFVASLAQIEHGLADWINRLRAMTGTATEQPTF